MITTFKNLALLIFNSVRRVQLHVQDVVDTHFPEIRNESVKQLTYEDEFKEEVETYLEYPIEKVDDDKPVKKYKPYDGPVSMTP
jgi:trans-2-enoyl-CoA reductase